MPIDAITKQPTTKKLDYPFDHLKSSTIEPPEEPKTIDSLERSSSSEQYPMLTDSSCEETLIESSSEENVIVVDQQQQTLTNSSYVKCMLAEAMSEKAEPDNKQFVVDVPRDNSPISSERFLIIFNYFITE